MKWDVNNKSTSENPVGRFMVAAGAVIELNSTGKILILQRSPKLDWHPAEWEICYGRIDQFEDVETGLKRELFEELGLKDIKIVKVLRVWHIFRGSMKAENELIGVTYHCRTSNRNIKLSKEHTDYQWLQPEKALKFIKNNGIKDDLKVFIREYNKYECPKCGKEMTLKNKDVSNNRRKGKDYKEYQRIIYWCKNDDVWISYEFPLK